MWRERLGCWWLTLSGPTQAGLGSCLGALSLHLGERLEGLLGWLPPRARLMFEQRAQAEPGCGWLEQELQRLQLPEFPAPGGFEFSLPPVPRLLPQGAQLWRQAGMALPHRALAMSEPLQPSPSLQLEHAALDRVTVMVTTGFTAGLAIALFATVAIGVVEVTGQRRGRWASRTLPRREEPPKRTFTRRSRCFKIRDWVLVK